MIRPDIRAWFSRWSESLIAGAIVLVGCWLALLGGWFFAVIGALTILVGAALFVGARRRMPFRRKIDASGIVEIDEGAIRYLGATVLGGEIALHDLIEIRLLRLRGHGHWRLRNNHGEALLIPVDAAGSDKLADAFNTLPGLDMGMVSSALAGVGKQRDAMRVVWRRPA